MSIEATKLMKVAAEDLPLVVDVEALVATDLLEEAALQFAARHPLQLYQLALWLTRGKKNLSTQLADRVNPGIESVPLHAEVLQRIRDAQASKRPVYLASASDRRDIERLAERIGGIAGVLAADPHTKLSGDTKSDQLVAAFGSKGYDYIGDSQIDFAAWHSARTALAVVHSDKFETKLLQTFPDAEIVARPRPEFRDYFRAIRTYQWAKNFLIFLPMIAGHRFDAETIAATVLGFVCFCLAASSAYVINDLLDLPGDRNHPRKSGRPFAAGKIPIGRGIVLAAVLMTAAFLISLLLPWNFIGILSIYIALTYAYSLLLKRKILIDVITLGGLYTLRVYGGLAATDTQQTQWLLMFTLFLFLSLAIVKRCSELAANDRAGRTSRTGRSYRVRDLNVLSSLGAAAGYGAVFVVMLYLSSPDVIALYEHPKRLWLICPLLLHWISRALLIANRGEMHDDPIIFAVRDRTSWIAGFCVAGIIAISI